VLVGLGEDLLDVVRWAADQTQSVLLDVLDAVSTVAEGAARLLTAAARAGVGLVRTVVEGLFDLGRAFVDLLGDLHDVATDTLATILEAAFDAGATVLEFVGHAVAQTYRTAADLVAAALDAGVEIAELLEGVVSDTYWNFRQLVNGILEAAGPVGDVLDWVLTRAENAVSELWHDALLAVRFAGETLTDVLDWAADATDEAFEAVVRAWESIGEALVDLYEWASDVGGEVWELLGEVTFRIGNSVSYVLGYLENDVLPAVRRFVTGLLRAGYALAELTVRLASVAVEVAAAAVSAMLDFGVTLADLVADILENPSDVREHLLEAAREAGRTVEDLFRAAEEAGLDAVDALTEAFVALGESAETILNTVLEVAAGAIGVALATIVQLVSTFRELTATERQVARDVFEDTIDLDDVRVTTEPTSSVVFDVQAWLRSTFGDAPPDADGRPFVTMTVINVDPDATFDLPTLVHELTHVWQGLHEGPFYMAEAVHAQLPPRGSDGYNYGHDDTDDGEEWGAGGASALNAANGDLDAFNPEQQARIVEHYYVRTWGAESARSNAAWQPYVDAVRAAGPA
jgi:hypothetical protein